MKRSKAYKKLHHKINKVIKQWNDNLLHDEAYQGRFVLREMRYKSAQFEDGSGYYAHIGVRIYDRKTGIFRDQWFSDGEMLIGGWKPFWFINNFIAKDVDVWKEPKEEIKLFDKNMPLRAIKRFGWEQW